MSEVGCAAAVMTLAMIVQLATGSGFGVVAAPLLMLVAPGISPVALLLVTVPVMAITAWPARRRWRQLDTGAALLVGSVASALAAVAAPAVPRRPLELVLGAMVVLAALATWRGWSWPDRPGVLVGAAAAGGVMGALVATPGPPMVMVYRHPDIALYRAGLALYFLAVSVVALAVTATIGTGLGAGVRQAGSLLPGLVIGSVLGPISRARIPARIVRPAAQLLSGLSGLALVLRGILGS